MAGTDSYEAALSDLAAAWDQICELEAMPPSPKRDLAIELLRAAHSKAVMRLREFGASTDD